MKASPSGFFLNSVEKLASDIYNTYGDSFDNFNGDLKPFKGIEELIKRNLNLYLTYPLKLSKSEELNKIRLSQDKRDSINKAIELIKTIELKKSTQEEKDWVKALFKKFRDGDDDYFPYPYIFKPPSPPREEEAVPQLKAEYIIDKKEQETTPNCRHCGADLPNGELICHVCGKKI